MCLCAIKADRPKVRSGYHPVFMAHIEFPSYWQQLTWFVHGQLERIGWGQTLSMVSVNTRAGSIVPRKKKRQPSARKKSTAFEPQECITELLSFWYWFTSESQHNNYKGIWGTLTGCVPVAHKMKVQLGQIHLKVISVEVTYYIMFMNG